MNSEYKFSFEKLEVWQESRALTKDLYQETQNFPKEEKFGITNQIRRAAVSICSNIEEGSSRTSQKDQAHFYQLAYSSLMEVVNQIIISHDLEYIGENDLDSYRTQVEKLVNKLNALRNARLNK